MKYRPDPWIDKESTTIVIEVSDNNLFTGELKVTINWINTKDYWLLTTYCSSENTMNPDSDLKPEDDIYYEYWFQNEYWKQVVNYSPISKHVKETWCNFINKSHEYHQRYVEVYWTQVLTMYETKHTTSSDVELYKRTLTYKHRKFEFTGIQWYQDFEWNWVYFNLWKQRDGRWTWAAAQYLETLPYFFDRQTIAVQEDMIYHWNNDPDLVWGGSNNTTDTTTVSDTSWIIFNSWTIDDINDEPTIVLSWINNQFILSQTQKYIPEYVTDSIYKYSLSDWVNITSSSNISWSLPNYISTHINWWSYASLEYKEYPFTIYAKYNRKWTWFDYPALIWVEFKQNASDQTVFSTERIEVNNPDHKEDVKAFLAKKAKARIDMMNNLKENDIKAYFELIKIWVSNWFYLDWKINWLILSKDEIYQNVDFFSNLLFEFQLQNDSKFRNWYISEYTKQKNKAINEAEMYLDKSLTSSEKDKILKDSIKWTKDWVVSWTRDFLLWYIDLINDLSEITFDQVKWAVWWVWKVITNPIDSIVNVWETIAQVLSDFEEKAGKAIDRLENLWSYEYSKWTSYVWTLVWLTIADPYWKLFKLWKLSKIADKIDKWVLKIIQDLTESKIWKLGWEYINKFDYLGVKIVGSFDKTMQEHIFKRMWMMDEDILKKNLDDPDWFIKSFEDGKYPMLIDADYTWRNYWLKLSESWKLKMSNWNRVWYTDFVIFKDWSIALWENHSYISGWKNVLFAWWIDISQNSWVIKSWNIRSWHYIIEENDNVWKKFFMDSFKDSIWVDLNNFEFTWKQWK